LTTSEELDFNGKKFLFVGHKQHHKLSLALYNIISMAQCTDHSLADPDINLGPETGYLEY
jgi:hypothetical protein